MRKGLCPVLISTHLVFIEQQLYLSVLEAPNICLKLESDMMVQMRATAYILVTGDPLGLLDGNVVFGEY
ncbi:hypothetical protein MW887_011557 [Aspergillus wentii]|nr:hypothetical protein MW887_011557 [Aspergillus wentii]